MSRFTGIVYLQLLGDCQTLGSVGDVPQAEEQGLADQGQQPSLVCLVAAWAQQGQQPSLVCLVAVWAQQGQQPSLVCLVAAWAQAPHPLAWVWEGGHVFSQGSPSAQIYLFVE